MGKVKLAVGIVLAFVLLLAIITWFAGRDQPKAEQELALPCMIAGEKTAPMLKTECAKLTDLGLDVPASENADDQIAVWCRLPNGEMTTLGEFDCPKVQAQQAKEKLEADQTATVVAEAESNTTTLVGP